MMAGKTMALILGAVLFSVLGQICLKAGAQHLAGGAPGRFEFLLAAARNTPVLLGIAALAASTICWLFVLRVAPLSRAYGLTSLTYVLTPLAGVYLFGEQIRRMHGVGTALIVVGIAFLLYGDQA